MQACAEALCFRSLTSGLCTPGDTGRIELPVLRLELYSWVSSGTLGCPTTGGPQGLQDSFSEVDSCNCPLRTFMNFPSFPRSVLGNTELHFIP
jgi:hypothetical protein